MIDRMHSALDALASVLDPHGTVMHVPTRRMVRPWACLYRRRRTRQRIYIGRGVFMALALVIGLAALIIRLTTVIVGTALWVAWVLVLWALWIALAVASYAGHVMWRMADLIGRD